MDCRYYEWFISYLSFRVLFLRLTILRTQFPAFLQKILAFCFWPWNNHSFVLLFVFTSTRKKLNWSRERKVCWKSDVENVEKLEMRKWKMGFIDRCVCIRTLWSRAKRQGTTYEGVNGKDILTDCGCANLDVPTNSRIFYTVQAAVSKYNYYPCDKLKMPPLLLWTPTWKKKTFFSIEFASQNNFTKQVFRLGHRIKIWI